MIGNVSEFCSDWLGSYSARDQVDPLGSAQGETHVTRGGNHQNACDSIDEYRSAYRPVAWSPELLGFRIVIELNQEQTSVKQWKTY